MADQLGGAYIDGKFYRRGYTTGTTATAAAYAAALLSVGEDAEPTVPVQLPGGITLEVPVYRRWQEGQSYFASVIKDGGDDLDVTNGLEIIAEVIRMAKSEEAERSMEGCDESKGSVILIGGVGVGVATKGGLQVAIGEAAINPVPRQMIVSHVQKACGPTSHVQVTITIPAGEAAAKKTFNPRLGIEGGISIIGTTGIVEPMSEEAWKKSLEVELTQKVTEGHRVVALVPGNHGEKFAVQCFGIPSDSVVTMSNFVGFMMMEAVKHGLKGVLIVGHVGKLIKLAGGIFHTHSRVADGRTDILCSYLAQLRAPYELMDQVRLSNTTDEAVELLQGTGYECVFQKIAEAAQERCLQHVYNELEVEIALYDMKGRLLGTTLNPSDSQTYFER